MRPTVVDRDETAGRGRACRASGGRSGRAWVCAAVLAGSGLAVSACGLHVSKHGFSGNVLGHSFSGATGALPAGFPSAVPVPDSSRVLAGGGDSNHFDVAFAATGSLSAGATTYQGKFRSAGYSVTNVETGSTSTPSSAPGSAGNATSTTVTLSGSTFTATNAQWTVEVEAGNTSSSKSGALKPGEYAINITVVPTSSTTTTG